MKTNLRWSSFYEKLHKLWLDIFYIFQENIPPVLGLLSKETTHKHDFCSWHKQVRIFIFIPKFHPSSARRPVIRMGDVMCWWFI